MDCVIAYLPPLLFRRLGLLRFQRQATCIIAPDQQLDYTQEQDTLQTITYNYSYIKDAEHRSVDAQAAGQAHGSHPQEG